MCLKKTYTLGVDGRLVKLVDNVFYVLCILAEFFLLVVLSVFTLLLRLETYLSVFKSGILKFITTIVEFSISTLNSASFSFVYLGISY